MSPGKLEDPTQMTRCIKLPCLFSFLPSERVLKLPLSFFHDLETSEDYRMIVFTNFLELQDFNGIMKKNYLLPHCFQNENI